MKHIRTFGCLTFLLLVAGCPGTGSAVNPYLVYTETFGLGTEGSGLDGSGQGVDLPLPFRRDLNLAFTNLHSRDELNVSFVAWVDLSSITSAQQQDALIDSGYVQLTRQIELGTAFTLPVGTFVYNGGGTAGATAVLLGPAGEAETEGEGEGEGEGTTSNSVLPATQVYTLLTPDAILAFAQPPVSCDSVAFYFTNQGDILVGDGLFQGATAFGPYKTFAQVDVYQCDPLRPGLFFNLSGASSAPNEYMEGQNILFQFRPTATSEGDYAVVTISDPQ